MAQTAGRPVVIGHIFHILLTFIGLHLFKLDL